MMRFGATTCRALRCAAASRTSATMVVVPHFSRRRGAGSAAREPRGSYLASPEGELYFALLSTGQTLPARSRGDAALLDIAGRHRRLNRFTARARRRPLPPAAPSRVWSDGQNAGWVGTQGGKLQELNQLLRGATDTTSASRGRSPGLPPNVVCHYARRRHRLRETGAAGRQMATAEPPRFDGRTADVRRLRVAAAVAPSTAVFAGSLFQRVFFSRSGVGVERNDIADSAERGDAPGCRKVVSVAAQQLVQFLELAALLPTPSSVFCPSSRLAKVQRRNGRLRRLAVKTVSRAMPAAAMSSSAASPAAFSLGASVQSESNAK